MTDQPSRSAPLAAALLGATNLLAVVISGRTLDAALAEAALSATPPTGPLRAAVMDLAYSTLRSFGRGDFLLAQLMAKPLTDVHVRCLLLITLNRLETRPEHAYAIVDQAVTAASHLAAGNFKGLVNGVLRNFLRRQDELLTRAKENPVAHYQHPAWWITRLKKDHPHHWQAILAASNTHPPMTLRANLRRTPGVLPSGRITNAVPLDTALHNFSAYLTAAGLTARAVGEAAWRLDKPVPTEQIPGFHEGLCSVQDAGAQRAALLLDVQPGQRVLDACAAPGGKAAHLLEIADLHLLALDADPARAARITENFVRLDLLSNHVHVRTGDACLPATWWNGQPFDRILADVPCTASGVVRRHPDAKWLRRVSDIDRFVATQTRILDAIWHTLASGGKMLYATCSLFAAENEDQVAAFIGRHADAQRLTIDGAPSVQLLPHADHDGFFYALLQKN